MHYAGRIEGSKYVGGMFGFIDYCHEDELGIMELCGMLKELGQSVSNDYYLRINGDFRLIKSDAEVVRMCQFVDTNRLVELYSVCNVVDVIVTQGSQVVSDSGRGNKSKQVIEEVNDSDTDDYDPNSSSSDSEYEEFDESDCDLKEDDALSELNVDQQLEDNGVGITGGSDDEGSDELGELNDEDSDELESLNSSSESDDDNERKAHKKKSTPFLMKRLTWLILFFLLE